MLEVDELTYAAIITITLPGVSEKATATVTLTPQDNIKTSSGETKALRDCTLREIMDFADSVEAEVWQQYQSLNLGELANDENAHVKITILNETGQPLAATAEEWLSHAVILSGVESLSNDAPASEAATAPTMGAGTDEEMKAEVQSNSAAEPGVGLHEETPPDAAQPDDTLQTAPSATDAAHSASETQSEPASDAQASEHVNVVAPKRKLRIAGLRRPVGHRTSAAVDVLINEQPFRDAQAHSLTSLDREVAGVLVGPRPEKQPDGRYVVHVTDIVIAKHTRMHGASVTYTPESWRYIHDKLAERYPNEEAVIVGWYHTHPGFGIFLSGMDLFIHQNFFTQIWHIALVLDPQARRSGFFCWDRGKSKVSPYDFPWPDWAAKSW